MTPARTCNHCGRTLAPGHDALCGTCRVPRARSRRSGPRRLARAERYLRQAVAPPALIAGVERQLERRGEDGRS